MICFLSSKGYNINNKGSDSPDQWFVEETTNQTEGASVQYHHVMAPKLNLNPVAIYKSSSQGKLQMCVEAACTKKL